MFCKLFTLIARNEGFAYADKISSVEANGTVGIDVSESDGKKFEGKLGHFILDGDKHIDLPASGGGGACQGRVARLIVTLYCRVTTRRRRWHSERCVYGHRYADVGSDA